MTKKDINKIFANIRPNNERKFRRFKRTYKHRLIGDIVENILQKQGFETYEDIKASKPKGVKMSDYLWQLIDGGKNEK